MAEIKKPSLTVLGGSMAGTKFLLPEPPASLLVGSDLSCHFRLDLEGVSPGHARISVDASGVTLYEAGSPRGLYVNDNPVLEGTPLRNGDIVWLGVPGEADVVMLQCILPPLPAPELMETMAIAAEPPYTDDAFAGQPEPEPLYTEEAPALEPAPLYVEEPPALPVRELEPLYVEEPPALLAREPEPLYVEEPPPPSAPEPEPLYFDEPPAPPAPEPEPLYVEEAPLAREPEPLYVDETAYSVEVEPVDALPAHDPGLFVPPEGDSASEATMILSSPADDPAFATDEPDETLLLSKPFQLVDPAPPPPRPPPPKVSPPGLPTPPPAPAPRPRPSASGSSPAVSPRRTTQALPRPEPGRSEPPRPEPAARPRAKSRGGLYVAVGAGGLLVLGAAVFAAWWFLVKRPPSPPAVSEAELRPSAAPPTFVPAPEATPAAVASVEPSLYATAAPVEITSALPTPLPLPTVRPSPSPAPSVVPPTPKPGPSSTPQAKPTAKGPATPAPPSAEAVRAQQVASLLAQAESALAARQYDQAVAQFDEVLKLDPQNARASAARATAIASRDAARRTFVPGRTAIRSERASSGGLAGFEGADVQAAAAQGRIEFEMTPASGIRVGDTYSLKVYLVNDGKKAIKIVGMNATTVVNGAGTGGAVASRAKQVEPQQRVLLGELTGLWKEGTTSWSTEVLISANKGDSLRNTVSWR